MKNRLTRLQVPKVRVPKRVRNVTISAGILLILLVAAGIAYTWLADRQPQMVATAPASTTVSYTPVTPRQPAPNAPEGVAAEIVTSPVAHGDEATVSVRTNPTSTCKIALIYDYDYSKKQTPVSDPALSPQTADAYGSASWTWTIAPSAPAGPAKATVTCTYATHTAVVQSDIVVTK